MSDAPPLHLFFLEGTGNKIHFNFAQSGSRINLFGSPHEIRIERITCRLRSNGEAKFKNLALSTNLVWGPGSSASFQGETPQCLTVLVKDNDQAHNADSVVLLSSPTAWINITNPSSLLEIKLLDLQTRTAARLSDTFYVLMNLRELKPPAPEPEKSCCCCCKDKKDKAKHY